MKPIFIRVIEIIIVSFLSIYGFSQTTITPYPLNITYNKTTNIIFPYAIKSVDRGSKDILVQNAVGVENVLQLKAAKQNFQTTNLTVFTSDGKLYSFLLSYLAEPIVLNLSFTKDSALILSKIPINAKDLDSSASLVLNQKRFLHISAKNQGMKIVLKSIYYNQSLLWFKFRIANHSLIDYESDYVKAFITNKKRGVRTAFQQSEIKPEFGSQPILIQGNNKLDYLLAFPAFTISKDKKLIIQVGEKNGGRLMELQIPNKTILKARLCK